MHDAHMKDAESHGSSDDQSSSSDEKAERSRKAAKPVRSPEKSRKTDAERIEERVPAPADDGRAERGVSASRRRTVTHKRLGDRRDVYDRIGGPLQPRGRDQHKRPDERSGNSRRTKDRKEDSWADVSFNSSELDAAPAGKEKRTRKKRKKNISSDWYCADCGYRNFGRLTSCRRCGMKAEAPKPAKGLKGASGQVQRNSGTAGGKQGGAVQQQLNSKGKGYKGGSAGGERCWQPQHHHERQGQQHNCD